MKVLKDPNQVLRIMRAKLDELHKRFVEAGVGESTEISGQESAIIDIAGNIRHAIEDHGCFGADDMKCVYDYVDDAKEKCREYCNPRDTWFMKGRAEGAIWAMKEIEKRMEEEP
ncbi:hypothetical protein [Dialister sp. i34-0019-2H8]|uniref:hypothetical protein n=1 Tax=Dialister sp. i34-0019-2H8 TaxID=3141190 RepID=UPI0034AAA084